MHRSNNSVIQVCFCYLCKWVKHFQRAEQKHREQQHLLNCDEYLLRDMGLRRFEGRIEAVDSSRIKKQIPNDESAVPQSELDDKAIAYKRPSLLPRPH